MAKKKAAAPPPLKRAQRRPKKQKYKIVDVPLRNAHYINGRQYGPGVVKVPLNIARTLREQERRMQENDDIFYGKRAFIIGAGGRSIPVNYDSFDAEYAAAAPLGVATAGRFN